MTYSLTPISATFLRFFAVAALLTAAFLSPAGLSFVPLAVMALFLIQWRRRFSGLTGVAAVYLTYYSVVIFMAGVFNHAAGFALGLPLLYLLDHTLRTSSYSSDFQAGRQGRSLTPVGVTFFVSTPVLLALGLALNNAALVFASTAALVYLGAVGVYTLRNLSLKPVEAEAVRPHILAGKTEQITVQLLSKAEAGGRFRLFSPFGWVAPEPREMSLTEKTINVQIAVSPQLAGPQQIVLTGSCWDKWGLTQVDFEIEPIFPVIIPRARYAAWLAKKYLAGSNSGILAGSSEALKPLFGIRCGLEYYGNRPYQPGDSLGNIDWKRSLKYNELVSREYVESRNQPVLLLINLLANGIEEADRLAFDIVSAAINLAVEGIPASIAAYDGEKVVAITDTLGPFRLVSRALNLLEWIRIVPVPARYLNPPDLLKVKSNLFRLRLIPGQAARVLEELMQVEYANLRRAAADSMASKALDEGLLRIGRPCRVAVISGRNHDAEALSYLAFSMTEDKRVDMITI